MKYRISIVNIMFNVREHDETIVVYRHVNIWDRSSRALAEFRLQCRRAYCTYVSRRILSNNDIDISSCLPLLYVHRPTMNIDDTDRVKSHANLLNELRSLIDSTSKWMFIDHFRSNTMNKQFVGVSRSRQRKSKTIIIVIISSNTYLIECWSWHDRHVSCRIHYRVTSWFWLLILVTYICVDIAD
jgi:hypothetical protein